MITEEGKKDILNAYLELVYIISDKEYQKRVWILGEPSGSDFDEICCLFLMILAIRFWNIIKILELWIANINF